MFSSRTSNRSNSRQASRPRIACWCLAAKWKSSFDCLFIRGCCTIAVITPDVSRALSSNMRKGVVASLNWTARPSTNEAGSRLTVEPQSNGNLTVRPSTISLQNRRLRLPDASDSNSSSESSKSKLHACCLFFFGFGVSRPPDMQTASKWCFFEHRRQVCP